MNFTQTLIEWYDVHARDLPWRRTSNPYFIWLSEIILQQTRVEQGKQYWHNMITKWQTVEQLAKAKEDEVLKAWQGLGYYSRARNLHFAAKQIVELGAFPNTYERLLELKGVGEYTAAAIASIAFKEPVAVIDGNVYRVLSRYFGVESPIDSLEGKKRIKAIAQKYLSKVSPDIYNQAIMDFGATQCTPKGAVCEHCPLHYNCYAYNQNKVDILPKKEKRIKQKTRNFEYIYLRCKGKVAIRKRVENDIWKGLWDLPTKEDLDSNNHKLSLIVKKYKHVLTHQTLYASIYFCETEHIPFLKRDFEWINETDLDQYALPRLIEILIEQVRHRGNICKK